MADCAAIAKLLFLVMGVQLNLRASVVSFLSQLFHDLLAIAIARETIGVWSRITLLPFALLARIVDDE
jgi:hypothetical protein